MILFSRNPILAETLRRRAASLVGAVLIGLAALGFAAAADLAQSGFARAIAAFPLAALLVTPLGFALLAFLTLRYLPEARGSGIPQVMVAATLPEPERSPLVALSTAAAKLVLTVAGLALGASSGREGPTVQVGAALMVAVHRAFRVPLSAAVVIAGGAAGVSAAFNTPLAGIAFAIEELAAAYEQRLALLVMATVMIGGLVSLGIAGDYLYFGSIGDALPLRQALYLVPVVAVIGGLAGGGFSRALLLVLGGGSALVRRVRSRPLLFAAGCGLLVAAIGVATGGLTWGTGYEPAKALIEGEAQPLWFAPAKLLAGFATAASGIPGGIFAPSLSIGAGLGGLVAPLFPGSPLGAVALIAMTAYFVGVVRAPLTGVIIIMEMTGSRQMVLILIATALIAEGVAALVCPERLYHGLARPFRRTDPPAAPG
ncbi:chloride channel protein [Prosthecomicrobium pneumaticum]|uniref:H+/Cl- antiporter ClcA n=1 Tax=Prosthecomicrobium pneumaticum TaxID=81895 RepID=A0A7W9CVH6_9HYPH|nr:chloride channel protein [Prosthecomicrobium pneumaticum]MBB5752685.1 H+/Cl- antiporter ClcA [Prosthecomicrobium pneumaticum]